MSSQQPSQSDPMLHHVLSEVKMELKDAVEALLLMSSTCSTARRDNDSTALSFQNVPINHNRNHNHIRIQNTITIDDDINHINDYSDFYSHRHDYRLRQCNTLERKRGLRRVQRALIAFETTMDDINIHHNNDNTNNRNGNINHNSVIVVSLNESILRVLLDILTEIPKILPSYSSIYNNNNHNNNISNINQNNGDSDQLFHCEIIPLTCSIIRKYALLPLQPVFIDILLDHIVQIVTVLPSSFSSSSSCGNTALSTKNRNSRTSNYIICGQECFLDMMQIINNSLAIQNQTQQVLQHQQQQQQVNDHHLSSSSLSSTTTTFLFQLDANETIVLTTLFCKLSLQYLVHSWDFVTTTSSCKSKLNDDYNYDNLDREEHHDDSYTRRRTVHDINVDNHHNHRQEENHDSDDDEEEENYNIDKDIYQESGIQVRLLVEYLFQHLANLLLQSSTSSSANNINNSNNLNNCNNNYNSTPCITLEESLLQLFHTSSTTASPSSDYHEQNLLVEDYIDLISSFLIESVEYAMDVIHSSTSFLRKFITILNNNNKKKKKRKNQHSTMAYYDTSTIRRHIKDTIRHCSLATSIIQIFYDDIQLYHHISSVTTSSSPHESYLLNLFQSFSNFVATFCNDELLHHGINDCWSTSPSDVKDMSLLFDSADIVLFRLSSIILHLKMKNGVVEGSTMVHDARISANSSKSRGNKRRKVNTQQKKYDSCNNIEFMDKPTTATFLRAFHYCCTKKSDECFESYTSSRDDLIKSKHILNSTMTHVSSTLHRLFSTEYQKQQQHVPRGDNQQMTMEFQSAIETSNLLQACALSTLMLSDYTTNNYAAATYSSINPNKSSSEEQLLASLIDPIMRQHNNVLGGDNMKSHCNQQSDTVILDPLNPWSYLLGKKIVETTPVVDWGRSGNTADVAMDTTNVPGNIVSTASTSSVSDLKSNNTSLSSSKSNGAATDICSGLECKRIISTFVAAIPPGIDSTEV